MIGHYVHHHGSGHLHRARTLAAHLPGPVTGLSSLPRPDGWPGDWIHLARDDVHAEEVRRSGDLPDPAARGVLHWVPLGDPGLRHRAHQISTWIARDRPRALVVDQSVEVCVLARLHGVPVVGFTAPGRRGDRAHRLGFDMCRALVGPWPEAHTADLLPGVDDDVVARFTAPGAISRFPVRDPSGAGRGGPRSRRAVLVVGDGGDTFDAATVERMREATPRWDWEVLGRRLGRWHPDPAALLAEADVAVVAAGQNSVAEVAALRIPAVVVPQPRPFDEQEVTAAVLADHFPAVVVEDPATACWGDVLEEAAHLDPAGWAQWCDGAAAQRIADLVVAVAHEGDS